MHDLERIADAAVPVGAPPKDLGSQARPSMEWMSALAAGFTMQEDARHVIPMRFHAGEPPTPVTPRVVDVGISSGREATFQELKLSGSAVNAGNRATLIARDDTGETVTGVFAGYVAASGCLLVGTLTKAT